MSLKIQIVFKWNSASILFPKILKSTYLEVQCVFRKYVAVVAGLMHLLPVCLI